MSDTFIQNLSAERIGGRGYGKSTAIYKFEKIKRAKRAALAANPGAEIIDMGVGEPDEMAFPAVVALWRVPRFSRSPVLLFIFLPLSIFPFFGPQRTSVTLRWDPSPDKHVISYRIYYADVTRKKAAKAKSLDIGRTTYATIPNLVAGHTYYFVVRALNSAGRDSEQSNLVKFVAGSRPSNSK